MVEAINDLTNKIRDIYSSLGDEVSRIIFEARFLYFLTGDKSHMRRMLGLIDHSGDKNHNTIIDLIENKSLHKNKIIVYGTGESSGGVVDMLVESEISISFLCDSDKSKHGSYLFGLQIISPEELVKTHIDATIVISTGHFSEEIFQYLLSMGFCSENIYVPSNFNEIYFGESFLRAGENEIYIDAGTYNGDTIKNFIKFCDNRYKKIYAFEPDSDNYEVLTNRLKEKSINNFHLIKKGTWNKNDTLLFDSVGQGSSVNESGKLKIDVTTIDEVARNDKVTFIKMDIEGAELYSLQGAKNTIQKNKPRLAISIYHKPEDILTIPLYIQSLVPEYRFYLRHYSSGLYFYDTVLYAVL